MAEGVLNTHADSVFDTPLLLRIELIIAFSGTTLARRRSHDTHIAFTCIIAPEFQGERRLQENTALYDYDTASPYPRRLFVASLHED